MDRQPRRRAAAPAEIVHLLDLSEIRAVWGIGHERVYACVQRGELRAYGRPDRQKYYSAAELISLFGVPPPPDGPREPRDVAKLREMLASLALYPSIADGVDAQIVAQLDLPEIAAAA